ncbi:hypothetical protein [Vampirovibrio sp.]|uniref:hypothetical protein n=1 Tax=Vampirovibrio sp. TaxID=2717857 RepID=UPI003593D7A9
MINASPSATPNAENQTAKPLDFSYLPEQPLYGGGETDTAAIGWQLAPEPFSISQKQWNDLQQLGPLLLRFIKAIDVLYKQSQNPNLPVPGWVAELYDQGKPDSLLQFSAMKRQKSHLPLVLRPDLLLRENDWTLCEIDAVPGGLGFTSALNRFYRSNGFSVIEAPEGLPGAFLAMLKAFAPEKENPTIAIVMSDEAADYRAEMAWLVETIRQGTDLAPAYDNLFLVHPKDLELVRDQLVFKPTNAGEGHSKAGAEKRLEEKSIDVIYRFFELFDLPNIPKIELIQYAVKKGLVKCTPPFKPHVEEKLSLALLHHPVLAEFWEKELGKTDFEQLKQWVPQGWIVDPAPLPPQAVIANLLPGGKPVQSFQQLKTLSQKERELVLKPSGFSPLGWGSRGVTIGHDHATDSWSERLDQAMASFPETPYILQKFEAAAVLPAQRLNPQTGDIQTFKARTRLCPYYFVQGDQITLAGVLATVCPSDKKLIHGMKDAVLAPCQVK